ncbi:carboxylating nicotinate-nucleotide diphosphorylase [Paenibacillus thermoaerophilus]|uniref:nicotinate-nucleotide diphosphorylase (carboxylating) n=1 Tax=Paenibacillus thermoaerophilus TaxID=1215385 RepID=A0ABW2UYG6_9BACL|nr:carboxylating nicotinate-nucleotide diphosphorylase [Paenibacillus thermoaerophilus]TMV09443.1 carboxylating nicotinate-nucleotide diphosphorylase [Paenibacillus thermoaerophilus]
MLLAFNKEALKRSIRSWLDEDIGTGDVTTMTTVPAESTARAVIHVKEPGIVAGLPAAETVFAVVDEQLVFRPLAAEGASVRPGDLLAEVEGSARSILLGERLALNLLQRLSGIATRTRAYVDALEGLPVRLVDTRKTTPGLRALEKYAVRVGGGHNHRFGLYDAAMIKDNHIKAAGGVAQAIRSAREQLPHTMKIEIEVETFDQLREALEAGPDIIMLDNMDVERMKQAVSMIRQKAPHIVIEASGSVSLDNVRQIASTGIDVISVGRLTYSVPALDISLDLNGKKGSGS